MTALLVFVEMWLVGWRRGCVAKKPLAWDAHPSLGCRGRADGFTVGLAGRRTEWTWQKFWKGVCAVLERAGDLLAKGGFPEDALFAASRVLKLGSVQQSLGVFFFSTLT